MGEAEHARKQQALTLDSATRGHWENQDDNLEPKSMLNKYRHAIDPLSALMLGRSHTRY